MWQTGTKRCYIIVSKFVFIYIINHKTSRFMYIKFFKNMKSHQGQFTTVCLSTWKKTWQKTEAIMLCRCNVYNSSKIYSFMYIKTQKHVSSPWLTQWVKSYFLCLFGLFLWGPPIKLQWDLRPLDILSLPPVCTILLI